ncbi:MAG: sensor histidine kinase, partial [bacterium]
NNLQIICSLLSLQSRYIDDKRYLQFFKETQNRINSMALMHEKLYRSTDLASINTTGYIKELSESLFASYNIETGIINLKTRIGHIPMDIDTAIPLGLIINELVSNALKHAFVKLSKNKKLEIKVEFSKDKKGYLKLVVRDNGIGFPKDLNFQNTESLGLQLVCMLVDQLNGSIKIFRREGTRFTITCNLPGTHHDPS